MTRMLSFVGVDTSLPPKASQILLQVHKSFFFSFVLSPLDPTEKLVLPKLSLSLDPNDQCAKLTHSLLQRLTFYLSVNMGACFRLKNEISWQQEFIMGMRGYG